MTSCASSWSRRPRLLLRAAWFPAPSLSLPSWVLGPFPCPPDSLSCSMCAPGLSAPEQPAPPPAEGGEGRAGAHRLDHFAGRLPREGQRAAVLWTQLQARVRTPGSPHPGPLFPCHGPVCWEGRGSSGVTGWGGGPSSVLVPTVAHTHAPILLSRRVRAVGGQSFNLRTEREGRGNIPSHCFWKEVGSVVALSRAVMLGGRWGAQRGHCCVHPSQDRPWLPSSLHGLQGSCRHRLLGLLSWVVRSHSGGHPCWLVSSPPPQTLSLSLSLLSCLEPRMRLPWEPEAQ